MSKKDNFDSHYDDFIADEQYKGDIDGHLDIADTKDLIFSFLGSAESYKQNEDIFSRVDMSCVLAENLGFSSIHPIDLQSHSIYYYEGLMKAYKSNAVINIILINELFNFLYSIIGEEKECYDSWKTPDDIREKITELKEKFTNMREAPQKGKQTKAAKKAAALKPYFDEIIAIIEAGKKLKKSEQPKQEAIIAEVWAKYPEIKSFYREGADTSAFRKEFFAYKRAQK